MEDIVPASIVQLTPDNSVSDHEDDDEKMEIVVDENQKVNFDENRAPLEIDINEKDKPLTPVSEGSMGMLSPCLLGSPSLTVGNAIASHKAKQRQLANNIEQHVLTKMGGNLYPTREDKEAMAKELDIDFVQVNRWFANRRRKQIKQRKILGVTSPLSKTRADILKPEEPKKYTVPPCEDPLKTLKRKLESDCEVPPKQSDSMVAQPQNNIVNREMYQDQSDLGPPPPSVSATAALFAAALAPQAAAQGFSPLLLASLLSTPGGLGQMNQLMSNPQITAQLLQQVLAQQQIMAQMQQQQQMLASQAALASPALARPQPGHATWMSPPVSESPLEVASESSDMSDFSPRPHSPRFKDPHNIADPQMAKLLQVSSLSEKESIAIAVLTELASRR